MLSKTMFILDLSSKYLNLKFSTSYSLIFNANGLLFPASAFFSAFFKAMSKFPIPSLLKIMFINPFLVEMASMFNGSFSPLKSSITDIFKFNSSNATKVSPSNGALFMIDNFSIETLALGKLLNKLKSASANATLASTLSLIDLAILAFI